MLSSVKEVDYYYMIVADKPGESRKLLDFLSEKMVNLLALTAFPVGGGKSPRRPRTAQAGRCGCTDRAGRSQEGLPAPRRRPDRSAV
jgi:hypothetical protein